ncbi:MAG: DUF1934 domain-containing protein [Clostridiales bacterium]|nr:DUF1934 domain-containing protein [Clostridiales bacterium]MDY5514626.1 DUF1934 domain-containing protein [Candidatus Ventricola sp.]
MEEKNARLRICSRMREPDGGLHEIKNARRGVFRGEDGGIALEYDDEQDGERAHILLTADARGAQMVRRGMTSARLRFVPGERIASAYVTPYGEIPVAVDTRGVRIERGEAGGTLLLDYDVYVGGEKTASTQLEVAWRL